MKEITIAQGLRLIAEAIKWWALAYFFAKIYEGVARN